MGYTPPNQQWGDTVQDLIDTIKPVLDIIRVRRMSRDTYSTEYLAVLKKYNDLLQDLEVDMKADLGA
jgi:hypothetical protein